MRLVLTDVGETGPRGCVEGKCRPRCLASGTCTCIDAAVLHETVLPNMSIFNIAKGEAPKEEESAVKEAGSVLRNDKPLKAKFTFPRLPRLPRKER